MKIQTMTEAKFSILIGKGEGSFYGPICDMPPVVLRFDDKKASRRPWAEDLYTIIVPASVAWNLEDSVAIGGKNIHDRELWFWYPFVTNWKRDGQFFHGRPRNHEKTGVWRILIDLSDPNVSQNTISQWFARVVTSGDQSFDEVPI